MDPVTVSVTIARPRAEVFDYLADVANHPEFKDHFLVDWHLTREDSVGRGAGARFREQLPLSRFGWGDITLVEVERALPHPRARPQRQVQPHPRDGRLDARQDAPGGMTRVEYTLRDPAGKLAATA